MKHILILAISNLDARPMQQAIDEVEPARTTVVTDPGQLAGVAADEFVMTEAFAGQRTIRILHAAQESLMRAERARKAAQVDALMDTTPRATHTQKGL